MSEPAGVVCTSCGLILLNSTPVADAPVQKRRSEDVALKRRSKDLEVDCPFCGGAIPPSAVRCRHCSEIVNEDFYRERATRLRSRINYASWVAYIFGLGALLVFRPVGVASIAAGLILSIIYYAIPAEPPDASGKKRSLVTTFRQQFKFERVSVPIPALRKLKFVFVGTPLIAALVGFGANSLLLQRPIDTIIKKNAAFSGMEVSAHYQYWVIPGVVVYDLRSLSVKQRPIDVHTAFLEFAREMKAKKLERVELAYKGTTKFSIDGAGFQKLGQEYDKKNFDYVLYSFPRLFQSNDAKPANDGRDPDALLKFHRSWYGSDGMTRSALAAVGG